MNSLCRALGIYVNYATRSESDRGGLILSYCLAMRDTGDEDIYRRSQQGEQVDVVAYRTHLITYFLKTQIEPDEEADYLPFLTWALYSELPFVRPAGYPELVSVELKALPGT